MNNHQREKEVSIPDIFPVLCRRRNLKSSHNVFEINRRLELW